MSAPTQRVVAVAGMQPSRDAVIAHATEWASLAGASLEVLSASADEREVRSVLEAVRGADLVVLPHPRDGRVERRLGIHILRRTYARLLFAGGRSPNRAILAATDLTDPAVPALSAAWDAAQRRCCRLATLHCLPAAFDPKGVPVPISVFDVASCTPPPKREAHSALLNAHASIGIDGTVKAIVSSLPPELGILCAAREMRADLVVVGTHHPSWLRRLLLGSTCESVVRSVPCSVLVVPLGFS